MGGAKKGCLPCKASGGDTLTLLLRGTASVGPLSEFFGSMFPWDFCEKKLTASCILLQKSLSDFEKRSSINESMIVGCFF